MTTPQPRKALSPRLILGVGALLIALLASGLYAANRPSQVSHGEMHLPEGIEQPVWMGTAPASLKELYAFAWDHQAELQYIPCWCGCAPGHVDNYTCYWKRNEQGTLVYEEHAYG